LAFVYVPANDTAINSTQIVDKRVFLPYQIDGTAISSISAAKITSGNLGIARMPTGGGTWAVGGNLTTTGGFITNAEQPRASAFNSAAQSVPNNTWTALTLNSEDFDIGSLHSTAVNTSRMTIPTSGDGLYLIIATGYFAGNATGVRGIRLTKNGSIAASFTLSQNAGAGSFVAVLNTALLALVAGDFVEAQAFQDSGGALNVGSAVTRDQQNSLQIVKLW
jgi:hypothetical protein